MKEITLIIEGTPIPKGRPRFMRNGHTYTPNKTRQAEEQIRLAYKDKYSDYQFFTDVPLTFDCIFYLPIPKGTSKKMADIMRTGKMLPLKKPDIDNLTKLVLDALNGTAYADDKQVVRCTGRKMYTNRQEGTGYTFVWIKEGV